MKPTAALRCASIGLLLGACSSEGKQLEGCEDAPEYEVYFDSDDAGAEEREERAEVLSELRELEEQGCLTAPRDVP